MPYALFSVGGLLYCLEPVIYFDDEMKTFHINCSSGGLFSLYFIIWPHHDSNRKLAQNMVFSTLGKNTLLSFLEHIVSFYSSNFRWKCMFTVQSINGRWWKSLLIINNMLRRRTMGNRRQEKETEGWRERARERERARKNAELFAFGFQAKKNIW